VFNDFLCLLFVVFYKSNPSINNFKLSVKYNHPSNHHISPVNQSNPQFPVHKKQTEWRNLISLWQRQWTGTTPLWHPSPSFPYHIHPLYSSVTRYAITRVSLDNEDNELPVTKRTHMDTRTLGDCYLNTLNNWIKFKASVFWRTQWWLFRFLLLYEIYKA